MTAPIAPRSIQPADGTEAARLWRAAHDLEGVFISQLFQAMRQTVSRDDGILSTGPESDMFSSMLDEVLGQLAARRYGDGLGEVLYRQLSRQSSDAHGKEDGAEATK